MGKFSSPAVAVTREAIIALRGADAICLDLIPNIDGDPTSQMRAIKRMHKDGWDGGDATYSIPVGFRTTCYSAEVSHEPNIGQCFVMFGSVQYTPIIRTILELLRDGDELAVHWMADNNSQLLTDHGWHFDEVYITLRRGKKTMEFLVDASCTNNSMARTVRLS